MWSSLSFKVLIDILSQFLSLAQTSISQAIIQAMHISNVNELIMPINSNSKRVLEFAGPTA